MSGAFDIPQMKEGDVLKSLAAGLCSVHLQRKRDSIYIINLKRTWEKILLAACAIENAVPYPPGILAGGMLCHWSHCYCQSFLEPLPTRSSLWELLSQRRVVLIGLLLLSVTQTLLCTLWTLPSHATTRELILQTGLKVYGFPLCLSSSSLLKIRALSLSWKTGMQVPLLSH
ncbi:hypothetical protein GH733_016484 [Mirounga leonina]|nr:hypothetical protein GH733_016484 [Mirounga leonina]